MANFIWDPGSGTLGYRHGYLKDEGRGDNSSRIFSWLSKVEINKLAHITNGNRGQRGRGIICTYWNKGPSLLINKHQEIMSVIDKHKPHILGLGEANFRLGHDIADANVQGYHLHLHSALDRRDLGNTSRVAVYTHELLRVKRRRDLESDEVAAIWLECGLPNQRGVIVCMGYRQWRLLGQSTDNSASVTEQLARWTIFVEKWESAIQEDKEVIVMMDANLDYLTWRCTDNLPACHSSIRLRGLIDLLFERIFPLGVSQLVNGATRFERGQPKSGLDHLYTNKPDKLSAVHTVFTGMSDHKLLKVTRYTKSFKQLPRYVRKRIFKNFNEEQFIQKLNDCNINEVLECYDVNEATNMLTEKLTSILDILAPVKTIQVRANYLPGLSEETKQLQEARNKAQEKASSTDDPEDWRMYKSLRNLATAKVREDKKKWEMQKFTREENSSTDIWKTLKCWLGWTGGGPPTQLFCEGRMVSRPSGLAACMNKFFIKKVKDLRLRIPAAKCDPLKYLKESMTGRVCEFKIKPVSLSEVTKLIKCLKNSSATGVDFIDVKTIKLGADILAPALQHIINLSIESGTFPTTWKWHKVVPLLKTNECDKLLPKSFRPVALLPVMSKLLEKAVFVQLVQYLEVNELVHPNLHGSRAGHSTSTALIQLYDNWVEEVEQGKMVGVLLCDQSAAFDLCDHYLLIEKLKLMGVEESATTWFLSYLSGRKQSCMVDGCMSPPLELPPCGVPQGSIGGPILWLVFTCDQPDVIHEHLIDGKETDRGCRSGAAERAEDQGADEQVDHQARDGGEGEGGCGVMVGYVDDGAYSYASDDPNILSSVLTYKYNKLAEWMNSNKLVINPDKTHVMVMGSRKHRNKRKDVTMLAGDYTIVPSESEKLLGGLLHQDLGWGVHLRDHKASLLRQLNSRMYGLRKICRNACFSTKLSVANGVFMSKMVYLITLWGSGAQQYLLRTLQVQQLAAARVVCGVGSLRWSRRQLLEKVSWLSVKQLIFYHTVLQIQKTRLSGVPKDLYQAVSCSYPRDTRSAAGGQIRQHRTFSSSTFKYNAIQTYNSVPEDVRTGTTATVKHKLRKWIKANIPID